MRRIIFFATAALLLTGVSSCFDDSGGRGSYGAVNRSISDEEARQNTIMRDVLGGALTSSVEPQVFSFDSIKDKAISINVAFQATQSDINETYTFEGNDGRDSLTINATGKVEEIETAETDSDILKFASLNLVIHFDNFIFQNACGVEASITGDVECRVDGTYNRKSEEFKGGAICASGTLADTADIIYKLDDDEHKIHFSVNVSINGGAFNLESYRFTGTVVIDGRIVLATSIFDETLSCKS